MSYKVTMQHVADAVGVSKYVVSKSLSGKGGVNEATRERVRQAAVKLGYRFNARGVSKGDEADKGKPGSDKATIVVLLPNVRYQLRDSLYWGRIVDGITKELELQGIAGVVITDQTAESFLSIVHKDNIQGFIGVGEVSAQVLQEVGRLRVPIVLIDHEEPLVDASQLFANNRECVYQLTNHLISLGHQSLRFVGNTRYSTSFASRWSGYKEALEEHGLTVYSGDPLTRLQGENRAEHAEEIKEILSKDARFPSALVCANDSIAISAMDALRALHIQVPEEVSITGFDNIEDSFHTNPRLTTVNVEKEILGRRAVQILMINMKHPDFPKETIYMSASLIYRDSIASHKAEQACDTSS